MALPPKISPPFLTFSPTSSLVLVPSLKLRNGYDKETGNKEHVNNELMSFSCVISLCMRFSV